MAYIKAITYHLPEMVVSNEQLETEMGGEVRSLRQRACSHGTRLQREKPQATWH